MKDNAIGVIEKEIKQKEEELEKLKLQLAKISLLETDISALRRTLTIIKGEEKKEDQPQMTPLQTQLFSSRRRRFIGESIPNLTYNILKEVKKPLNAEEIISFFAQRGRKVDRMTLVSGLYREIKHGGRFKLYGPGLFGLAEWSNKKD